MTTSGQAGALIAGRYRLERLTGGGTRPEEIWQGFDEVLNRPVMLRLLPLPDEVEPDLEGEVHAVVAQVARLGHPNIAQVYDVGHGDGLRYVVSEWTGGRTLGQIMATGRQRWQRAVDWGQQIAEALAALHSIGLIDGVLGPETVSVLDDRRVKLTDVGLTVPQDGTGEWRRPGAVDEPPQDADDDATRVVSPSDGDDDDATRVVPPSDGEDDDATRVVPPSDGDDEDATRVVPPSGEGGDEATRMISGGSRGATPEAAPADVYALGAILWTAIVGVPPEVDAADTEGPDATPLREVGVPADLGRLLKSMLAASAAVRPTASVAAGRFATLALEAREPRPDVRPTVVVAPPTQGFGARPPVAERYEEPVSDSAGGGGRRAGIVVGLVVLLVGAGVAVGLVLANSGGGSPGTGPGGPVPSASTGVVSFSANPQSTSAPQTTSAPPTVTAPTTATAPKTTSAPSTASAPSTSSAPTTPSASAGSPTPSATTGSPE